MPQVFVKVDRDKVLKQGVDLAQVYQTLQTFMGGFFVNYFNRFGRQWQVYVEAEGDYRTDAKNVGKFMACGNEMVRRPVTTLSGSPVRNLRCAITNIVPRRSMVQRAGYSSVQPPKRSKKLSGDNAAWWVTTSECRSGKKAQEGVPARLCLACHCSLSS